MALSQQTLDYLLEAEGSIRSAIKCAAVNEKPLVITQISKLLYDIESLSVKFDHELDISFNSRYLIDVASQLDGDNIEIYLKDTGSPALIRDPADYDSIYVVMPMKG